MKTYKRRSRVNDDKLYYGLLRSHKTLDLLKLRETAELRVGWARGNPSSRGRWLIKLAWVNAEIARRVPLQSLVVEYSSK